MSNRNNDVFQVLVTKGNVAVLAKDLPIENLAVGQLGAFNPDTNLSIDATSTMPKNLYFAVGKGEGAVLEDIRQSAGQLIQKDNLTAYSFKAHTAGQPMVINVGGFNVLTDAEYAIRVEFRNSRIYRIQGFNQFSKAYSVITPMENADANTLSKLFVAAVNNDEAGLLVAKFIARQALVAATHGTSVGYAIGAEVSAADVEALIVYNAVPANVATQVFVDFSFTSVPLKVGNFAQVNLGYHKLLETVLIVSLVEGFSQSGATTISQYPVFEEGSSNNIKQKEYHASGWSGSGPYKLSPVTGTAKGNIEYLTVDGATYDQFIVEYNQVSDSGFLEYSNVLSTIFATPEASHVTRDSVAALLDAITGASFEALASNLFFLRRNITTVRFSPLTSSNCDVLSCS
jgi:hypothetical protein